MNNKGKILGNAWYWGLGSIALLGLGTGAYFLLREKEDDGLGQGNVEELDRFKGLQGHIGGGALPEPQWDRPFRPEYHKEVRTWVAPEKLIVLKPEYAKKYAKALKDADGGWFGDDDESAVSRVFAERLKDKVQVSQVATYFQNSYDEGLYDFLQGFLNEGEMARYVDNPVSQLKKFRTA